MIVVRISLLKPNKYFPISISNIDYGHIQRLSFANTVAPSESNAKIFEKKGSGSGRKRLLGHESPLANRNTSTSSTVTPSPSERHIITHVSSQAPRRGNEKETHPEATDIGSIVGQTDEMTPSNSRKSSSTGTAVDATDQSVICDDDESIIDPDIAGPSTKRRRKGTHKPLKSE